MEIINAYGSSPEFAYILIIVTTGSPNYDADRERPGRACESHKMLRRRLWDIACAAAVDRDDVRSE
jgi:hypothetical protein